MFDLERYEKGVIVFLLIILLAGLSVAAYKRATSAVKPEVVHFNIENAGSSSVKKEPVNINEASLNELMALKRIGKGLGQRIIDYRTSKGHFTSKEEIKNVKGIGDSLFEEIKDDISVE